MREQESPDPIYIHIIDHRSSTLWRNRMWSTLTPVVLIGIGALLGSEPMQWFGFIFTLFLALSVAVKAKSERLTIPEARERLNELENDNPST